MTPIKNPYAQTLQELEAGLWEHDARVDDGIAPPYAYGDRTFRACIKIFASSAMWKLWEHTNGRPFEEKERMAEGFGEELRDLIIKYTGIDPHDLWRDSK